MANIKITDLPELSETPNDANLLEIVDKASETPTSKKITWANIKAAVLTAVGKVNEAVGFTLSGGTTSKTLTVEDTSVVNQDLTTDASPTFANITDLGLTASQAVFTDANKKLVSKPFATAAEITTGTEAAKAIAPDQLKAANIVPIAYAGSTKALAGTDTASAMTPADVKTVVVRVLMTGQVTITNANTGQPHWLMTTALTANVSLPYSLPNANYTVLVEVEDADFKERVGEIKISSKAINGFTITVTGNTNNIDLRWTVVDPNYWTR